MILEGLLTTENADGSVNVAPMGPIVEPEMTHLLLRPYRTSTSYANLKRTGRGVFHVTDDAEMLARAALGALDPPRLIAHGQGGGWILADACRWYAFEVVELDDSAERTEIHCDVVDRGRLRDFFGFNRAKHAVVEAAILATRVRFLPAETILEEMKRLAVAVEKTAGEPERRAFALLDRHIRKELGRE